MTVFKINEHLEIRCSSNYTKQGFCHRATLYSDGTKITSTYISYLNRTWERYQFESVLKQLLVKAVKLKLVTKEQSTELIEAWSKNPDLNGMGALRSLGMIMKMGELLTDNKKDTNDWKVRMMKAGLPENAINMPEDWSELPESEKTKRLNGITEMLLKSTT